MTLRKFLSAGFCTLALSLGSGVAVAAPVLSDFVIHGTGTVSLGNNVTTAPAALIGSAGNISIGGGNGIDGSILSGGSVTVGNHSLVSDSVLAAGNIAFGGGGAVGGTAHAGGNLQSGNNAVFSGAAKAGGTVSLGTGTAAGSIQNGVALPLVPLPASLPGASSFAAGTTSATTGPGGILSLGAGSYGNLATGNGATLTLTGGSYFFNDVSFGGGTLINLDLGLGAIVINIAGDLLGGNNLNFVLSNGGSAANVLFEVHGDAAIGGGSHWLGSLFAPGQDIAFGNNVTITGAIYGEDVRIGGGSRLVYTGSDIMAGRTAPGGPAGADVPVPGALLLFGFGLFGLALFGLALSGLAGRRRQAA